MVLGKKVAIFEWEWGRNSAPRDWQKIPCLMKPADPDLYFLSSAMSVG